ncbi:hypothetical protein SSS_03764 [Sarcoptes scabiei]|nr:hypothetical protein SSS_03764 [Sarcoptes scabiei]
MKIYLKTLSDESKNVEFAVGKHTLGRGPLLDCTDKKVSRTHASIEITKNGEVIITSLHVNPTFYFGQDSESSPKLIKKDNSLTLSNGDIFGFQAQQYKYQVIIEGINGNATVKNVNSGRNNVTNKSKTSDENVPQNDNLNGSNNSASSKEMKKSDEKEASHQKNSSDSANDKKDTIANSKSDDKTSDAKKRSSKQAATNPKSSAKDESDYEEEEEEDDDDDVEDDEEEDDDDDEEEDEEEMKPSKNRRGRNKAPTTASYKGRPRRAQKQTKSNVSLDDFVASDDDLWRSESEDDYKPKRGKKRAANSESDSDWEVERKSGRGGNRAANRGKKSYAESESDSDSDWGKKKKQKNQVELRKKEVKLLLDDLQGVREAILSLTMMMMMMMLIIDKNLSKLNEII